MKEETNNNGSMPWHAWGCMAIAFSIPLAKKIVPGFIALLAVYVLVYFLRRRRIHSPTPWSLLALLASVFVLHVAGLFWSENPDSGINEIGIKLSLIVFPIIAWLMPPLSKKQVGNIQMAFVYGCLLFIPIALGYGVLRSIQHNDFSWLSYEKLGIYYHPTYAATYQAMAFFIVMRAGASRNFLFNNEKIHYVVGAIILIFISMLASKAGLIAAAISISMSAWLFIKPKRKYVHGAVLFISSIAMLVVATMFTPETSTRVESAIADFEEEHADNMDHLNVPLQADTLLHTMATPSEITVAKSSTQLRLITWKAAIETLKENPFGCGTGDTKNMLIDKYVSYGETYAAQKKLNAHNQFLQYGAEFGWLGLGLICALVALLLVQGFQSGQAVVLNFAMLCGMNFLFESFLEVQAGIVFFCFWIMVFTKNTKSKTPGKKYPSIR